MIVKLIEKTYALLWGDLFTISLGNSSIGISLMILLLVPAGIYFTIRTGISSYRYFPQMIGTLKEKKESENSLSSLQTHDHLHCHQSWHGIWSVLLPQSRQEALALYSGCG